MYSYEYQTLSEDLFFSDKTIIILAVCLVVIVVIIILAAVFYIRRRGYVGHCLNKNNFVYFRVKSNMLTYGYHLLF